MAMTSKYGQVVERALLNKAAVPTRSWTDSLKKERSFSILVKRTDQRGYKIMFDRSGKRIQHKN
jgi:hypothetical protein